LRDEQRPAAVSPSDDVPDVEVITITEHGGYTETPTVPLRLVDDTVLVRRGVDTGLAYQAWEIKDRSDSGCRLHGQITDGKAVVPGTLIAFRERGGARALTVAVVRRFRLLIGKHVEIGVEYVGRDPRAVRLVTSYPAGNSLALPSNQSKSFAALYLPESPANPVMPIKTVIMAAHESASGRCLSLTSAMAEYTVRLKEPIEEQVEFVWMPCEIVEMRADESPN
jgi:hypothetical protein